MSIYAYFYINVLSQSKSLHEMIGKVPSLYPIPLVSKSEKENFEGKSKAKQCVNFER